MPSIYVMRHGPAEAAGGRSDAERPLSFEGMRLVTDLGAGLRVMDVAFDVIFTSPLLRATQTAEVVAAAVGAARPQVEPGLAAGAVPESAFERLRGRLGDATLIVGHMPDVSFMVGYLVFSQPVSAVVFTPATLARIDFAAAPRAGSGTIRWVMPPDQILRQGLLGSRE